MVTHLLVPGLGGTGDKHRASPGPAFAAFKPLPAPGKGSMGKAPVTDRHKQKATNFPFKGYNHHTFFNRKKKSTQKE